MLEQEETEAIFAKRIMQRFSRSSQHYDTYAVLPKIVGERLAARLDYIAFSPKSILDLGCGTGILTQHIMRRYPGAQLVAGDHNSAMLNQLRGKIEPNQRVHCVGANANNLPFTDACFDLVMANLLLPWLPNVNLIFKQIRRILDTSGLFLFSTYGPDTLTELRQCWQTVDAECVHERGGWETW